MGTESQTTFDQLDFTAAAGRAGYTAEAAGVAWKLVGKNDMELDTAGVRRVLSRLKAKDRLNPDEVLIQAAIPQLLHPTASYKVETIR